jgi:hypothetical protein
MLWPRRLGKLLRNHGPLIVSIDDNGASNLNHTAVAYGIDGEGGTRSTSLSIANGEGGHLKSHSGCNFRHRSLQQANTLEFRPS